MTAPRWDDVPEAERERARRAIERARGYARRCDDTALVAALDAALARLAEPEPDAAARWRAVPAGARADMLARLERHADEWAQPGHMTERRQTQAEVRRALLALAREAETSGR